MSSHPNIKSTDTNKPSPTPQASQGSQKSIAHVQYAAEQTREKAAQIADIGKRAFGENAAQKPSK